MIDQMKRILKLVRRTGDTMVVTDPNGEDVYVVMNLDQYENLLGLNELSSEQEESDRFNEKNEDFSWMESEISNKSEISTDSAPDIWETMKPAGEVGETWDTSIMSEEELANLERQYKEFAEKSISDVISSAPDSNIDQKPEEPKTPEIKANDDDFGEEQFYLEPID